MEENQQPSPNPTQPVLSQTPITPPSRSAITIKSRRTPKALLILVIVIFIALLGSGGFYYYQNSTNSKIVKVPSPTTLSVRESTSNWNTFKFDTLTIKYPPTWTANNSGYYANMSSNDKKDQRIFIDSEFNFDIASGKKYSSLESELGSGYGKVESFKLDGTYAISYGSNLNILSKDKSVMYKIQYTSGYSASKDLIDSIISTIKVSNAPSNIQAKWKTFENELPNFSFKYPSGYTVKKLSPGRFAFITFDGQDPLKLNTDEFHIIHSSYPLCSEFSEPTLERCVSELKATTVGGKNAQIFSTTAGIDSGRNIIQITDPKIELDMFIAGGGLSRELSGILSTFKFTN